MIDKKDIKVGDFVYYRDKFTSFGVVVGQNFDIKKLEPKSEPVYYIFWFYWHNQKNYLGNLWHLSEALLYKHEG